MLWHRNYIENNEELVDEIDAILDDESTIYYIKKTNSLFVVCWSTRKVIIALYCSCSCWRDYLFIDASEILLVSHGLTMNQTHGQGYDEASNMKWDIKRPKTLIMQESHFAYYARCYAHRPHLVLIAVSMGNTKCEFFWSSIFLLNNVGVLL
jgi:hypothetical protein